MTKCIFCEIVKNKSPSYRIWEDKKFLAILDTFPNTDGMVLVLTKKHYTSDVFSLPSKVYSGLWKATGKVTKLMRKRLRVNRVAVVSEGMGIDHDHVKLYPLHGVGKRFRPFYIKKKVFFKKYPGYLTTVVGPKAEERKLKSIKRKFG